MASPTAIMPQIEHVVLLMLENRSLDNVAGWTYLNSQPKRVVPAGSSASFDGLSTALFNSYDGTNLYVQPGTQGFNEPMRVPNDDPYEPYAHVTIQLFGDSAGNVPNPLNPGTPANMQGFAYDYDAGYQSWSDLNQIMGAYLPSQLTALTGLAQNYAISDRWFSSVPTQTNPNRAFTVCGTSLGRVKNQSEDAVEQFNTPTIWNALRPGTSFGLYYQDIWEDNQCFTQYTFPWINKALTRGQPGEIKPIKTFYDHAARGTLPAFSFLEPAWGYGKGEFYHQGNDYHPPTEVGPGEQFVCDVYNALTANQTEWQKTLLIITFDEHGGNYDHVDPGWGATQPDSYTGPAPDYFKFDRWGVRVPTIMASPWIPAGTVFRSPNPNIPYDHTSFISTILTWRGIDPAGSGLGKRVAVAPTFESVLGGTMRTDIPKIVPGVSPGKPGRRFAGEESVPIGVMRMIVDTSLTVEEVEARIRRYKARGARLPA